MIPPFPLPLSSLQWSSVPIVGLACFVGLFIMANLFEVSRNMRTARQRTPDILVPTITALGIWVAVFTAIQSHVYIDDITYSAPLTIVSFLLITGSFLAAYMLAIRSYCRHRHVFSVTVSSLIAVIATCTMHFTLMVALQLPGLQMYWTVTNILVAVGVPVLVGLASSFIRLRNPGRRHILISALGAGSLVWLHIYSLMTVELRAVEATAASGLSAHYLGQFVLAIMSILVLVLTLFSRGYLRFQSYFFKNIASAIEAMPVGLAFYDRRDRLMLWNKRYANLHPEKPVSLRVGMSYRDALLAGVKDIIIPEAERADGSWITNHSQNHHEGDWLLPYATGEGWIQLQSRRTTDEGLITTVTDFTSQIQKQLNLQNQLIEANSANLAKSRFLANMSHEIRTPLNGVMAVAETLSRTPLSGQQTEMVNLIRQSSQTLQILLTEILDLARVETGQLVLAPEPVDLEAIVNELIQLHAATAHEKGVSFDVSMSPAARAWVDTDALRLKQILGNVLSNAVKFTHEGRVSLTVNAHENLFHFIITDTGIGFPPEFKNRLFGRFEQADSAVTRKFGGSGLGLAICSELVTMMKGSINGDSIEGVGSTFSITLPLTRVAAPVAQTPVPSLDIHEPVEDDQGLRILLADDNATNRRVVQLIMESTHARMSEVENGKEALDAYLNTPFDLILMDMQMPVMDGLSAVRAIRDHENETGKAHTPIIMLTANAMPEHVKSSMEAGADAHLAKPFNVTQLLELAYKLTAKAP